MSLKFRNNRWPSYLRFQKVSSSAASTNGKNAGTVTSIRNGATLKGSAMINYKRTRILRFRVSLKTFEYAFVFWQVETALKFTDYVHSYINSLMH
jgi:hypothetical protein